MSKPLPPSLLQRATDGDEDAQEAILSTYATIARLVQEAMDEERRQCLAAAMANSLLWPADGEEVERRQFLRYLAEFEGIHTKLLAQAKRGLMGVRKLTNAKGSLGENAKAAWQELYGRRMVAMEEVNVTMTPEGTSADQTTPLGSRFLQFIGGAS